VNPLIVAIIKSIGICPLAAAISSVNHSTPVLAEDGSIHDFRWMAINKLLLIQGKFKIASNL
jgi:hypothetical protein